MPKYVAFLERFPTSAAARPPTVGEVVTLWAGLGYNRRAVNLHRCAAVVVERHGGTFPDDLDALLALPGIGPYTARAVLAFAFEHDVGVVDTNAARVLARAGGPAADSRREAQAAADAAVPAGQGWAWNQAMLDLGATVCTARNPSCGACARRRDLRVGRRTGCRSPTRRSARSAERSPSRAFAGSDRQGRGRLVDALRSGPVDRSRRSPRPWAGPTTPTGPSAWPPRSWPTGWCAARRQACGSWPDGWGGAQASGLGQAPGDGEVHAGLGGEVRGELVPRGGVVAQLEVEEGDGGAVGGRPELAEHGIGVAGADEGQQRAGTVVSLAKVVALPPL